MTVSRECTDVQEESVSGWYQQLKTLMIGYKPKEYGIQMKQAVFFFQIRIDFNCSSKGNEQSSYCMSNLCSLARCSNVIHCPIVILYHSTLFVCIR